MEGLRLRAEGFDLVPGEEPMRVAKTKKVTRHGGRTIKPLRVYFHIGKDDKVHLLFVETMPDPDLDDIPFSE
jgi:hypothetical protein